MGINRLQARRFPTSTVSSEPVIVAAILVVIVSCILHCETGRNLDAKDAKRAVAFSPTSAVQS